MRTFLICLICLIVVTQANETATAVKSSDTTLADQIEDNYQRLTSPDFDERFEAVAFFDRLKKEEMGEKVLNRAIELLKRELKLRKEFIDMVKKLGAVEKAPKEMMYLNSERFGLYKVALCRIAGKSQDKALIPLLTENCLTGEVLIYFGDAAVEPVIEKFRLSDNPIRKTNAVFVLGELLKPKAEGYVAKGDVRNRIKKTLIQAVSDNDRFVRSAAVEALGDSRDKDLIPILENIAKNDPYHFEKKNRTSGKMETRYPVREDAEKALQKLKARESEKK